MAVDNFVQLVTFDICLISEQPRSIGRSRHCPLCTSYNHWPVSSCSRPPSTCPKPLGQSEPHRQPASESEPGRRFHQPRGGQPEHEDERTGRACNGGRGEYGARLAGLVVLCCKIRHFGCNCVLQLQPESLYPGDEHPPPHVPVSLICCLQLCTFYICKSNYQTWLKCFTTLLWVE